MENDNQVIDAVESQEFDIITENIETPDSEESDYGTEYVEEESTSEVVEESQETVQEDVQEEAPTEIKDIPHKEDPSRFEFWQSKFTQEQNARKELEEKFQSFQEKLEQPNTPELEPEVLTPPVKPTSDDPLEMIEYLERKNEYLAKTVEKINGTFEQQQEAQRQQQEQARFKAFAVGEYQKVGADQKESMDAFNFFSSEESLDFKNQLEMYRAWKGASKSNPKVDQMKTHQEKYKAPLPPGVASGESDVPKEPDFGDDLLSYQKNTY